MSAKKNLFTSLALCWLLLILSAPTGFAQIEQKVGDKFWVAFPKNLAVFHILVLLTPSRIEQEKLFGHPLAREARDYFRDFKNHPAVQATDKIFRNMWYFPLNYSALFYTDFPEAKLKTDIALPPEFADDETMKKMISDYVQAGKDFYVTSRFEEFWKSHIKDAEAIVKEVCNNLPAVDIPDLMEKFYGSEAQQYYIVPCPFMQNSATHAEARNMEGGWQYYYLAGGDMFSDSFYNTYFAFHEFSHSFIEPISSAYSAQINELEYLYKPLRERFQQMGYRDWDRAFNEHMVTAGQLHLTRQAFGEEKKEKMMEREKGSGFKLIERFYAYFEDYDKNRDKYGRLEAFYPRIIESLSRIKVEEYRKPGRMGFYPEFKKSQLFVKDVIPDSAFEKAGIQKGDILLSIGEMKITTENSFREAKEKWWDGAKEGNSVEVVVVRNGEMINKNIVVPFVTNYRYIETSENYPADFAQYEFLRYSGGQEIFSPDKIVSSDNNWEILLSCVGGKTREELQKNGINLTESQLMLLKAMGFLDFAKDAEPQKLITTLPILGFSEKQALIQQVRSLVYEMGPQLRDDIKNLEEALHKKGWEGHTFSILFSAVVDGIVWFPFRAQGFVKEFALDQERPLFDGVYWAYYPKREFRCGTNIAIGNDVFMILNWSDGPMQKIQEIFHWDNLYALRDEYLQYGRIANEELRSELIPYRVVNDHGDFTVPIIEMKPDDRIFLICQSLAAKIVGFMVQKLDLEKLREEFGFADKEKAFVVAYHEWMWEFMEYLDEQGLIRKPLAFSAPEKAGPLDIGKLFFIARGSVNSPEL